MPELPEVETILNGLQPSIANRTIIKVKLNRDGMRIPFHQDLGKIVKANILNSYRRGKYIIIELNNSQPIIIHLGMSGKLFIKDHDYITQKHDHIEIFLDNNKRIILNDPRRFGLVSLIDNINNNPFLSHLGPEPLSDDFNESYLYSKTKNKSKPIKSLLMDNTVVVGVGNIYACESLFRAKIHPKTPSNSLKQQDIKKLVPIIREVLQEAIAAGGSTLKDYTKFDGSTGYFQHQFDVYNQKECKVCKNNISRENLAGRSTFFCNVCQS